MPAAIILFPPRYDTRTARIAVRRCCNQRPKRWRLCAVAMDIALTWINHHFLKY